MEVCTIPSVIVCKKINQLVEMNFDKFYKNLSNICLLFEVNVENTRLDGSSIKIKAAIARTSDAIVNIVPKFLDE